MADILTHLIHGDETINKLSTNVSRIINNNRSIFNLGAQGPDLFFYYRIFPWSKADSLDYMGMMIHQKQVNDFFANAFKMIKQSYYLNPIEFFKTDDSDLHKQFAYITGFLCHYALDTKSHPYIFYYSGKNGGYNHKYYECILDTVMADVFDTKAMKLFKTGKAIKLKTEDRFVVASYLSNIISQTFDEDLDHDIIQVAIKDMKQVLGAMKDEIGFKRKGLRLADKLTKAKGKIATASFPVSLDPKMDYLNLKHATWYHPCDPKELHNESFLDLIKQATHYGQDLIQTLVYYLIDQVTLDELLEKVGNKCYDTGRHIEQSQKMIIDAPMVDFRKTLKIKK